MLSLIRRRSAKVGPLRVTVNMPDAAAERITGSEFYKFVARPVLRRGKGILRWIRRPHIGWGPKPPVPSLSNIPPSITDVDRADLELRQLAAGLVWQQVVELSPTVVTPGALEYRAVRHLAELPDSLAGLRCLDAARRDGFWAFEMEARGAAEVVALDWAPYTDVPEMMRGQVPAPDDRAFALARELKESTVHSLPCSIYDLDPSVVGKFDLVIVADVLSRLRNPELGLERLLSVCRNRLILAEPFDPRFDRYGDLGLLEYTVKPGQFPDAWWMSGGIYWLRAMQMAGFGEIREKGRWQADLGGREPVRYIVMEGQVPEPELPETKAALGRHGINLIPKIARPRKVGFSLGAELVLNLGDEDPLPPLVNNLATPQEVVDDPARPGLKDKVEAVDWYHTIELGNGVVTPGFVDHRAQLPQYHLPESFAGKRCLDVATFDGFWSFEFERRGASEVVGADIQQRTDGDIPNPFRAAIAKHLQATMGEGFRVAHAALDSKVDHRICNVYDLAPERVGLFDFVFVSDLLLHIRDPQLALERIFSVATGDLLVADVFMPGLDHYGERSLTACPGWMPGSYTWWMPGVQTLKQMMLVAGFESIEELGRFRLATLGGDVAKVVLRAKVPAWKQEAALTASAAAEPVKAERARRGGRADRRETKG